MPEYIFKHVKEYLNWDGEDRDMKTSAAMQILLHSGTTLQVTKEGRKLAERTKKFRNNNPNARKSEVEKTEVVDVKFANGRIVWGVNDGAGMCQFGNCWKNKKRDGKCDEHDECRTTHFLLKDADNPTPTYILLSTQPHSPKFIHTLDGCLQSMRNSPNNWPAFVKYENNERIKKRVARAEDVAINDHDDDENQELNPNWKLVTKHPWISQDSEYSNIFKQTVNIILSIMATINANAADQLNIVGDKLYIDKVDWSVVNAILGSWGFQIGLGDPSKYGTMVESPLLKKADLKWRGGDQWIYWKFGTVGRIYVGTVKQENSRGPMPKSYIHPRHGPNAKGIPIFQGSGDDDFNMKETAKMEGVGQLGVILCQMLGGTIDENPILIDFTKYEHFSEWEQHHLANLKALVGFWSSQQLEFTPPETLDISAINWNPVKKYLRAPDIK